ncbi:MAG: TIGR00266 family protein [Methanomicrobiales archaeon]|nr:TIGR00266 family protein [Methanomicrobiales archaeon]
MRCEIKYQPSYAMLVVHLSPGETITAEAGSMTYMNRFMEVHTRMRERGILGSLGLSLIGGQSFFVNDFTASGGEGEAGFVAAPVGDIQELEITPDEGMIIQKASYIASTPGVELDIEWQGFTKGLFGQGIFMIKVGGSGILYINTFGAIDRHELGPGETLTVDNFHLVAFSDTCQYSVHKFGGLKETILGGEGLVTEITGPGKVFIQTKNIREFTAWIWQLLEPQIRSRSR